MLAVAAALTGCSAAKTTGASATGSIKGQTITYWASNQGASLSADAAILKPEIAKFEKKTGATVKLQVLAWPNLTPNTLSAAVSGKGPDVVNMGNTNAVTFQTTGGFVPFDDATMAKIGGKSRFIKSALATAGAPGEPPTSLPLYSQVYGLFYNKALFAAAGLKPPTTWEELVSDAKKLTVPDKGQWGIVAPAGTVNTSMHMSFIFAAQHGGSPFTKDGQPSFTNSAMIDGVQQYVDLMSKDHVVNTSDAQDTDGTQASSKFASGKIGMYYGQTASTGALTQVGMKQDQYGIVPIPAPAGDAKVSSFVAGSNVAIMKSTKHLNASLQFVKFLESDQEQEILNKAYGSLPVIKGVPASAFASYPDQLKTWTDILANHSKPLSLVPSVQAFQTNVGGAVVSLFARAATGKSVSRADIKAALDQAQQKMATS